MTAAEVRAQTVGHIAMLLAQEGRELPVLADGTDLLAEGIIDSFGLLELLEFLDERFGVEVEFEGPDAERLTELGELCRHVAERAAPAEAA